MGTTNLQIATWGNLSSNGHTIPSGKDSKKCVTYNDLASVSTVKPFTYSYYRTPGTAYNSTLTINMPITKVTTGFHESGNFVAKTGVVIYSFKPEAWIKSKVKLPLKNIQIKHYENTSSVCEVYLKLKLYLIKDGYKLKESSQSIRCYHDANTNVTYTETFTINWEDFEIDFSQYNQNSEFEIKLDYSRDASQTSNNSSYMQYNFIFNYDSDYVNYYTSCKCVAYNLILKI